jgi:hypothetical protein
MREQHDGAIEDGVGAAVVTEAEFPEPCGVVDDEILWVPERGTLCFQEVKQVLEAGEGALVSSSAQSTKMLSDRFGASVSLVVPGRCHRHPRKVEFMIPRFKP